LKTGCVEIPDSPLRPGAGPTSIHYRESGGGIPLLFLHGGWGYEVYPFDYQIAALSDRFRILIPDRSGYGKSSPISSLPADFHPRAAEEMLRFMDALHIDRAVLWGHSDGAVMAALLGLGAPDRVRGLILEAFHYSSNKAGSREWMRSVVAAPDSIGERSKAALIRDHGPEWRRVVESNASTWLEIGRTFPPDLYGGKLAELSVRTLFIYGANDPRTEPGDLDAVRRALPTAEIRIIEARHSPHSELASAEECTRIASEFLESYS
jgi:pimeloyl-ACP methyl ester carboxylesterase